LCQRIISEQIVHPMLV